MFSMAVYKVYDTLEILRDVYKIYFVYNWDFWQNYKITLFTKEKKMEKNNNNKYPKPNIQMSKLSSLFLKLNTRKKS